MNRRSALLRSEGDEAPLGTEFEGVGLQGSSPEVGDHADEARRVDRLDYVLLKASRKGSLSILLASVSRERDGWHALPFRTQPSNESIAVFIGHTDVADDHVGFHHSECREGLCCRARDRHLCAMLA